MNIKDLSLTDEDYATLEGWRENAEQNCSDSMGASDFDVVVDAAQLGESLPEDVGQDDGETLYNVIQMRKRIEDRVVTINDLYDLSVYGESLSEMDHEDGEDTPNTRRWAKISDAAVME